MAYQLKDFEGLNLSVAMSAQGDRDLAGHVHSDKCQEDLAFAYWKPSMGARRYTAIMTQVVFPEAEDRSQNGNVSFAPQYLRRVLSQVPPGWGVAFIHGHLGPGWQHMSCDDVVAERDRLSSAVAGRTGLPLLGLTRGTDGAWSGRFWLRESRNRYARRFAHSVRVVGRTIGITYGPSETHVDHTGSQVTTLSVWGDEAQEQLARVRVGVVGLGSVGSLVAEALSRVGFQRLTYIDFDKIERRNLDRTLGATEADVAAGLLKVQVAARHTRQTSTASKLDLRMEPFNLLHRQGLSAALDCDVLVSCVDRPWPRHVLNALAYSHLIPVVDGGISARVKPDGKPLHVAWRIHTIGPEHACMVCLGALRRSDVALDMKGKLDDPEYIAGLSEEARAFYSGRNVFPFSMSVAAHEVLQLIGLVTGLQRIGGVGPQLYNAYPGTMAPLDDVHCEAECEYAELSSTAVDLLPRVMGD